MARLHFVRLAALLAVLALVAFGPTLSKADYSEAQHKADLKMFEDAKVPHGDQDLIGFFQSRLVASEEEQKRFEALIQKMSSAAYKEREQARIEVEKAGPPALPLLRKVLHANVELEVKQRAERCIQEIEKKSPNTLVTAAARLLAYRQVKGALAVLMQYLPLAPDELIEEQISASIYALALVGSRLSVLPPAVAKGKLDPAMVTALADPQPIRRGIAALAVGRYGDAGQRQSVAKLLSDDDLGVRFRAAQALASAGEKSSVPVLLDLLEKAPLNLAVQAEDLLGQIAQDKGPNAPLGDKKELREKCHAAWSEWWSKNSGSLDLAKVEIETPFGGMAARATKGAALFMKVLLVDPKLDLDAVARVTDVPFTIYGQINFSTRQEFDDFFKKELDKGGRPPQDFKFKASKVVTGAEYVKAAPDFERTFLEAARLAHMHIVYMQLEEGMNKQVGSIPLFMRISGGRAKCLGLGTPQINKQ